MKLVPFATRVRIDVKAFPSCPSVPLLITNSIVHHNGLRHQKICLVAADGTQISFPTVLIFFLVTHLFFYGFLFFYGAVIRLAVVMLLFA
ncbi:hypothetical protein T06_16752, partial [Trichinella sp. T6]